ncbi:MAG TPA: hypothetical protein VK928_07190 [Longimicrobiales bacterium]|nr:hypothetical protein [Longimicrobiales bacterium]
MTPIIIAILVLASAVAFGRWRRFSSIQWIWTLFGTAIAILIIWAIVIVFVVGPEMKRTIGTG